MYISRNSTGEGEYNNGDAGIYGINIQNVDNNIESVFAYPDNNINVYDAFFSPKSSDAFQDTASGYISIPFHYPNPRHNAPTNHERRG